jgi:hypothetical protein
MRDDVHGTLGLRYSDVERFLRIRIIIGKPGVGHAGRGAVTARFPNEEAHRFLEGQTLMAPRPRGAADAVQEEYRGFTFGSADVERAARWERT